MIKKTNFNSIAALLITALISFSTTLQAESSIFNSPDPSSSPVNLLLNDLDTKSVPKNFRKTTDLSLIDNKTFNLTGLKDLNISGSEQFSALNLPLLLSAIDTKLPIIDVDLRQESHGFINGLSVSWENAENNANAGLSRKQSLAKEEELLGSIKLNVPLTFFNDDKKTIVPTEVYNENTLMQKNSASYIRIFATDKKIPTVYNIDYFVQSVVNSPKDSWFHFHCKEGIGRTTTFMIFYDMIRNYKDVAPQDIISRQINLVQLSESDVEILTSDERMTLYNNFFNYCIQYGGEGFKVPYREYIESISKPQDKSSLSYPMELVI